MDLGLAAFITEYTMPVTELAQLAENSGFESLFLTEHTHIPASRDTPYPAGGPLPEEYRHTLDPFLSLAAAAAVTTTLRLGTGVCLVTERDPIILAKEVASLDHLSGGRFLFGVGAGWNGEEMRNHGVDPARRWTVAAERVAAMRAIWSQEEASYHGTYVNFSRIWSWPKPTQIPSPPVLVAGSGPGAIDRVIDYGDGWMPIYGWVRETLPEMLKELRVRAASAGRAPVPVTVFWAPNDPDQLLRLAELGVDRAVLKVPAGDRATVLAALNDLAEMRARKPLSGASQLGGRA
jgi:probable F420-dependent oxidoreductase